MKLIIEENLDGDKIFYIEGHKHLFLTHVGIKYAIQKRNSTGKAWSNFYYKRYNELSSDGEIKIKDSVMREYCKQFCVENLI